jgi:hypothetical protein
MKIIKEYRNRNTRRRIKIFCFVADGVYAGTSNYTLGIQVQNVHR